MSWTKFTIPYNKNDLRRSTDTGVFYVEEDFTIRELKTKISEMKSLVNHAGADFVLKKKGFDVMYSVLVLFKDLSAENKADSFEILSSAMIDLIRSTDQTLCSDSLNDATVKSQAVNKLKMVSYLYCQLCELLESDSIQNEASCSMAKKTVVRKKKGRAVDLVDEGGGGCVAANMESMRLMVLHHLFQLLNLNLNLLFDPPIMENDLLEMIGNFLFKLLENPSIALQKCKDARGAIYQVLGTAVTKYNYSMSCVLKMVQCLRHFEHLSSCLAEAVEKIAVDFHCRHFVLDMIREVNRMDPKEMSRDTSGTRAVAQFLVELSDRVPEQLQPCLSFLLKHLEGESYMLRKAVLATLAEILLKLYPPSMNLDTASRNVRDGYLDYLELHMLDTNAHVRSSVLQAWAKLCSTKCIPLSRQIPVLRAAVDRLQDKSSLVRRQAIQLITTLLQNNPYNASLPLHDLKDQYLKEKEKLAQMLPAQNEKEKDEALLQKWQQIETQLIKYLEADNDQDKDPLWEEAQPGEIHERIRQHLDKCKLGAAISLLQEAKKKFPVFDLLQPPKDEEEQDEKKEKPKKDDDDDVDDESEAEDEEKEKEVSSLVQQLRNLYLIPLLTEPEPEDTTMADQSQQMELERQKVLVMYLKECLDFAKAMNRAVPVMCMMLKSKLVTDVTEAIDFFVSAFEFGLYDAMLGVRHMLGLVFSRESGVKAAVVAAYKRLYIDPSAGTSCSKTRNVQLVKNLIALVSGATVGDLAGLEELIGMLVASGDIGKECFTVMWQFFTRIQPDVTQEEVRSAMLLLGIVGLCQPAVITANLNVLLEHGLSSSAADDFKLVHEVCVALKKVAQKLNKPNLVVAADSQPYRLANDHEIFTRLESILLIGIDNPTNVCYVPMAQQAVAVIYALSEGPDVTCSRICSSLSKKLRAAGGRSNLLVSRLLHVVGHVAVCQLNYLDVSVFDELKRRNVLQDLTNGKVAANAKKKRHDLLQQSKAAAAETATPRRRSALFTPRQQQQQHDLSLNNDDEELMGAEADDAEAEFIRKVCEDELLSGPKNNMLWRFVPLILEICSHWTKYPDPRVRSAASLALAKYMLVSERFCDQNLQLFFTLLEKSQEVAIRSNLIIAAGDLSFRFPNLLEPWTPRMYGCLRDGESEVRSNTLIMLTHLILHDMIKVKGQIADMALCIVDSSEKIAGLARLFFSELSHKGNALYNIMPDIISRLSDADVGLQDENKFRSIMKYIIGLIEKDRHLESLVEKLCQRFRITISSRQWRDIAFCLSLFQFNERSLKKLIDQFGCYSDKLHDDFVYECLCNIVAGCRKNTLKQESKVLADELLDKIEKQRAQAVEDDSTSNRAANAAATAASSSSSLLSQSTAVFKVPRKKSARRVCQISDDEDEDGSEDQLSDDDDEVFEKKKDGKGKKKRSQSGLGALSPNVSIRSSRSSTRLASKIQLIQASPNSSQTSRKPKQSRLMSSDEDDGADAREEQGRSRKRPQRKKEVSPPARRSRVTSGRTRSRRQ